jgi:beta-N-acetylhexosaminidase
MLSMPQNPSSEKPPKRRPVSRRAGTAALTLAAAMLFTACTPSGTPQPPRTDATAASPATVPPSSASASASTPATTPRPTPTPTPSTAPKPGPTAKPSAPTPEQLLASLSLEQRVGQLFMVGANAGGSDRDAVAALLGRNIGNFYLAGRSTSGLNATAALVSSLRDTARKSGNTVPMFVATDQEGGLVQVLRGPGFSEIPTALVQAASTPAQLRARARAWGAELLKAGVDVDLAPVLDTVPGAAFAPSNAPIGYFQREYGYTPASVSAYGNAFASGLRDAGVAPVVKHYPGLGRVTLNTDVSGNVHDTTTTRKDPYLAPFTAAIRGGVRWVMVSNAYYDRIDARNPAPFSSVVMRTMLRAEARFTGVVVSDDLCNAAQLSPWTVGERAGKFIAAGGTMVLCADAASVRAMFAEVMRRATAEPAFRKAVDAAALTVLRVKAGK